MIALDRRKERVMIARLKHWWHARCRNIDLAVLWPSILDEADDIHHARQIMLLHAEVDAAWLALGRDEMRRQIKALRA